MSGSHTRLLGRLATAVAVAVLAGAWFTWGSGREPGYVSDFDQLWHASQVALAGRDPYAVSLAQPAPPGLPPPMGLYYPLTAVVIATPLAALPLSVARLVWIGGAVFAFAFLAIGRFSYQRLPAVMSGAFLMAVSLGQWSPILACAVMSPVFAWFLTGKPNVGLAAAVAVRPTMRVILLALAPVVIAFLWRPHWIADWRHAVSTAEHFRPYVLRPGGVMLVLALLRWRRPEARWLAAIACVPGTPGVAEALVLFAFPMTFRQCLSLALLTHAPNFMMMGAQFESFAAYTDRSSMLMLGFVYVPALFVILRRPNEGPIPSWAERLTARWPAWLRGEPSNVSNYGTNERRTAQRGNPDPAR